MSGHEVSTGRRPTLTERLPGIGRIWDEASLVDVNVTPSDPMRLATSTSVPKANRLHSQVPSEEMFAWLAGMERPFARSVAATLE